MSVVIRAPNDASIDIETKQKLLQISKETLESRDRQNKIEKPTTAFKLVRN
jgi:hypothetical protein